MRIKFLILISLCLSFICCQKDSSSTRGNSRQLAGEYALVNIRIQATANSTYPEVGVGVKKTQTVADYTTKNNQGSFVVDDSQFIANNVSFTVDTTVKAYFYANGNLQDSTNPGTFSNIYTYSSISPYSKVGSNSINFKAGFKTFPDASAVPLFDGYNGLIFGIAVPLPYAPTPASFTWAGDTLIVKFPINVDSTMVFGETNLDFLYQGNQWIRLKKK